MGQRIEPLSGAEYDWLADQIEAGARMVVRYNGPDSPPTLADLDDALEAWTGSPSADREDVEHAVTALGAAYGAHLGEALGLEWARVSDEFGVDIVLVGQPDDVVVPPFAITRKRIEAGVPRFFEDVAAGLQERLAGVRGPARRRWGRRRG